MELTKENLRKWAVESLKEGKKIEVVFRPDGVKFDEDKAVVRLDLETYNGFSVGDSCAGKKRHWATWGIDDCCGVVRHLSWPPYKEHKIAAFVEITAHLKGGQGVRIKDMFCIMASVHEDPLLPHKRILRGGDKNNASVLALWIGSLKKFGETEQK